MTAHERTRQIQERKGLTPEGAQAQIDREDLAVEAAEANTIVALRTVLMKMLMARR